MINNLDKTTNKKKNEMSIEKIMMMMIHIRMRKWLFVLEKGIYLCRFGFYDFN